MVRATLLRNDVLQRNRVRDLHTSPLAAQHRLAHSNLAHDAGGLIGTEVHIIHVLESGHPDPRYRALDFRQGLVLLAHCQSGGAYVQLLWRPGSTCPVELVGPLRGLLKQDWSLFQC